MIIFLARLSSVGSRIIYWPVFIYLARRFVHGASEHDGVAVCLATVTGRSHVTHGALENGAARIDRGSPGARIDSITLAPRYGAA